MAKLEFKKATKKQSKLRCALFGVSGAGKTYTALQIAKGFKKAKVGKKIAVIDSEFGSASKYSDRFDFDTLNIEDKSIANYVNAIELAEEEGYDILIIDSMTHAWKELLADVDKIAKAKYKGNSWAAWNEGTPKQNALIDTMLKFKGHLIATMRSKTEWTIKDEGGKVQPIRVGTAPEQGKGIEFEFDLLLELTPDHIMNVLKDRTGKFQDEMRDKPGEDFGEELASWLNEGEEDPRFYRQTKEEKDLVDKIIDMAREKLDWNGGTFMTELSKSDIGLDHGQKLKTIKETKLNEIINWLDDQYQKKVDDIAAQEKAEHDKAVAAQKALEEKTKKEADAKAEKEKKNE